MAIVPQADDLVTDSVFLLSNALQQDTVVILLIPVLFRGLLLLLILLLILILDALQQETVVILLLLLFSLRLICQAAVRTFFHGGRSNTCCWCIFTTPAWHLRRLTGVRRKVNKTAAIAATPW